MAAVVAVNMANESWRTSQMMAWDAEHERMVPANTLKLSHEPDPAALPKGRRVRRVITFRQPGGNCPPAPVSSDERNEKAARVFERSRVRRLACS